MSTKSFEASKAEDQRHFYRCKACGEMVDMRDLDEVWFHEDHRPHPDAPHTDVKRL